MALGLESGESMNLNGMTNLALLWRAASEVFPYFDQLDLDWDAQYEAFLPRMAAAQDDREAYLLLAAFATLLGDGHTDVSLPKAMRDEMGGLPFQLTHIGDDWHVSAIAQEGRPLLLDRVERLNGEDFPALLERVFAHIHQVDGHASHNRMERFLPLFLSPTGNLLETSSGSLPFDLQLQPPAMLKPPAPASGIPCRELLDTPDLRLRLYEDRVLYIALPHLLDGTVAETIRETVRTLPCPRGVILDLRGCIGGMTLNGARVAQLLIPGEFHACRKWTRAMRGCDFASASQISRWSDEAVERWLNSGMTSREELQNSLRLSRRSLFDNYTDSFGQPGGEAIFDQPCLLLTDRDTLSAAEDMTAMFRSNGRATILGERTYGSTGTPLLVSLRGGGIARVVSVGYRLLDGTDFINRGIQPDIPMSPSPDDLLAGHDRLLDKAIARLA